MILGDLSVVFGLVWQPFGQLAAWLALPFLIYTIRIVEWFAQPQQVLWAGAPAASRGVRDLRRELASRQIPVTTSEAGQAILLGHGAEMQVLEAGQRGVVYLVRWGDFLALLPLGLDGEILGRLQADPELGPVSVMMLADSDYAPANPPEWIARLRPQVFF